MERSPAVALFVERARAIRPEFALSPENAAVVAQICACLDGLPLAIELAAARIKLFPPQALLARLRHSPDAGAEEGLGGWGSRRSYARLDLLSGGARDLPPRHRSLRQAIGWSYDLLTAEEQALFRRLGVFVGGFRTAAAEAVRATGAGVGSWGEVLPLPTSQLPTPVVDGLAALLDQSLVRQAATADGEPRFAMLETIRDYGLERLEAAGEAAEIRRRHAAFFVGLAERAEPELRGPGGAAWLAALQDDLDNLRAVLAWSRSDEGDAEAELRLAGTLASFWYIRGYVSEGREWLAGALGRAVPSERSQARAKALFGAGTLAWLQSDYPAARALLEESVARFREVGDRRGLASSSTYLGMLRWHQGATALARALFEESVALCREIDDRAALAMALSGLGGVLADPRGDDAVAGPVLEESAALARAAGNWSTLALTLNALGNLARCERDFARAAGFYDHALALSRERGEKGGVAWALHNLGYLAQRGGDPERASALFRESLILWRDQGVKRGIGECLAGLAGVAGDVGQPERAARLFGATEALLDGIAARLFPIDQAEVERNLTHTRAQLPAGAFSAAWAEGSALTPDRALTYALETPGAVEDASTGRLPPELGPATEGPGDERLAQLSPRERQVAELVARGLSNRQIGAELVISEGTAGLHVKHILRKLQLRSRTQVATLLLRQTPPVPPA